MKRLTSSLMGLALLLTMAAGAFAAGTDCCDGGACCKAASCCAKKHSVKK